MYKAHDARNTELERQLEVAELRAQALQNEVHHANTASPAQTFSTRHQAADAGLVSALTVDDSGQVSSLTQTSIPQP